MSPPPVGVCALPDCGRVVPARHLMCQDHWRRVPLALRTQFQIKTSRAGRLRGADGWRTSAAARRCIEAVQASLLQRHQRRSAANLELEFDHARNRLSGVLVSAGPGAGAGPGVGVRAPQQRLARQPGGVLVGAVTDIALELARDIAAEYADVSDAGIRRWACGQIMGAWRLAMRLDHDAAEPVTGCFSSIEGRLKKPTPAPEDTP